MMQYLYNKESKETTTTDFAGKGEIILVGDPDVQPVNSGAVTAGPAGADMKD